MNTVTPETSTNGDNTLISILPEEELKPKIQYMSRIIKASKLISMWPREKKTMWYHLLIWVMTVNCILYILTFFIRIKMEGKNMDGITEAVDIVTVLISGTFRFFYIYMRGEKYVLLVFLIHNNFIRYPLFPNKRKPSIDKHYQLARRIILVYGCFTFFWILQMCLMPALTFGLTKLQFTLRPFANETEPPDVPYPIPIKVYTPFDITKQPANGFFYVYQSAGLMFFGYIYVCVDSFWYMVILLTIGQFEMIKESLISITEVLMDKEETDKELELLDETKVQEVERSLKLCVEHHQFTRKFAQMTEDIISPNILVDSLHAIISIAFILLDVTIALNKGDWNKVLYSLGYFTTSITHMFIFDWLGNELAEKEEALGDEIYGIPWYKFPSIKTSLLLLTAQSRKPCRLTGGRMYKLSLQFFTSTVRAIFSYFTFLFQLRNGKPGKST